MNRTIELQHLRQGPLSGEQPGSLLLQPYVLTFPRSAPIAILQMREVLQAALQIPDSAWDGAIDWNTILPHWFTEACEPEPTAEQQQERLKLWKSMSLAEKKHYSAHCKWSLQGWLYWLHPQQRTWHWWNAENASPPQDHIAIVTLGLRNHPCPIGAFEWLARSAGATDIQPIPLKGQPK